MKRVLFAIALMTLVGNAGAADKPNFSGEWQMNATKSNFGGVPAPQSFIRKIEHIEPAITIVEEEVGPTDATNGNTIRKIATDGKSNALEMKGVPVVASATWDGSDLIAVTALDIYGLTFKDRMSLSDDGKILTSKELVTSSQGSVELTIVFERVQTQHANP